MLKVYLDFEQFLWLKPYSHLMLQVTSLLLYLFWGYIKSCVDKSRKVCDKRILCSNVIFVKRLFNVKTKTDCLWWMIHIDIFLVTLFYNLFLNYTYNSYISNIILWLSITKWLKIWEFASWRNWRSSETCYFEVYDA